MWISTEVHCSGGGYVMTTLKSAIASGVVALLVAGNGPALAAKPTPPPPPPDPCTSPSVVTETTFPSFIFSREITVKRGPYTIGAFLADATGKCEKKISEAWPGNQEVNLRFDPDTQRVLIVGDGLRAAMTRVSFSPSSGPSVAPLGAPSILLTDEQIETPADLLAAGWSRYGTTYDPRISPDGTQILFHVAYLDPRWSPSWSLNTFWTCDLTYDGNSIIELIDPSSCLEVHRSPVNDDNNYGSHASWGTRPGTIYVLDRGARTAVSSPCCAGLCHPRFRRDSSKCSGTGRYSTSSGPSPPRTLLWRAANWWLCLNSMGLPTGARMWSSSMRTIVPVSKVARS